MRTTLILILILALAAVFTNPDVKAHKEEINLEFKGKNPVTGILGAGKMAAEFVKYEDYKLISVTKYEDKTISIGIFTKVFVLQKIKPEPKKSF